METNALKELSQSGDQHGIGHYALVLNVTDVYREGRLTAPRQAEGWGGVCCGGLTEAVHTVLWRVTAGAKIWRTLCAMLRLYPSVKRR